VKRHSCFDRPPFASTMVVQDGYEPLPPNGSPLLPRVPRMVEIPFRMTPGCVYGQDVSEDASRGSLGAYDPGCAGCSWRKAELP
jgi:hypothetical protein